MKGGKETVKGGAVGEREYKREGGKETVKGRGGSEAECVEKGREGMKGLHHSFRCLLLHI
jgi:hypothetical protein